MTTASITEPTRPAIRTITMNDPWLWLSAGWRDLWRRPAISLGYGLVFFAISWLLTACLFFFDLYYLLLPLAAGFMQLGPLLAVGLYEISRRLEAGAPIGVRDVMFVAVRSPTQIAFMAVILVLFMLAWVRIATLLFALFFGTAAASLDRLVETLFFTADGLLFLAVGSAVGAILAFVVFAISVVSIPRLMAREGDAVTAALLSVEAVRRNIAPMLLWAWLIVFVTAVGIVTLYAGLIVTFPLIGHATWHAYRGVIDEGDAEAGA